MARWGLATDRQLQVIVDYESDCPAHLLSGAVSEMLNRGLFDRIIAGCIHKTIEDVDRFQQVYHLDMDDLMQIGRIEVLNSLDGYKSDRGKRFSSFCYLNIQREILNIITILKAKKRDTSKTISLNKATDEGKEILNFVADPKHNVEKYVINKVTLEQMLKRVTKHEKKIMFYRLQGYTFDEISSLLGRGTYKSVFGSYKYAISKMIKGA